MNKTVTFTKWKVYLFVFMLAALLVLNLVQYGVYSYRSHVRFQGGTFMLQKKPSDLYYRYLGFDRDPHSAEAPNCYHYDSCKKLLWQDTYRLSQPSEGVLYAEDGTVQGHFVLKDRKTLRIFWADGTDDTGTWVSDILLGVPAHQ